MDCCCWALKVTWDLWNSEPYHSQRQVNIVLWGLMVRPEHARIQQETIALRKISEAVTSPSFHSILGTTIFKIYRNIKNTLMEVRIVPFQTLTRYHCHISRLLWAFLLSLPALVLACVNDDGEFSGKICSLGGTLIVPSQFALNRVKMRYEHFSLLLGIYLSDFFCRSGKGNEKLSYFASFVFIL